MKRPERPSAVTAMAATEFYKVFKCWPTVVRFEAEHWNVQDGPMSFLPMPAMRSPDNAIVHIEVRADGKGLGPELVLMSNSEIETWVAIQVPQGMRAPVAYLSDVPSN